MRRRAIRRNYGHATFQGIGRIAGRKLAYVQNGDLFEEHTLSSFRRKYGVSASKLSTGQIIEVPCVGCGADIVFDSSCDVQRCDQCAEKNWIRNGMGEG